MDIPEYMTDDVGKSTPSEQGLEEHLRTLEALVSAIGAGVVIADKEGRFLHFNDAAVQILGIGETSRPPNEWTQHYGLFRPDAVTSIPPGESPLERTMRGESITGETVFIRNAERPEGVWCHVTGAPVIDGQLRGGIVVFRDVTEEKRALQALEESEHGLRAVVETAGDAIITIDRNGIIQSFNGAAEEMFGYQRGEAIGQRIGMLMPPPHRENHDEYIARYLRTGEPHVIGIGRDEYGRRRDGTMFPLRLSVSDVEHHGLFTAVIHDLTESIALQQEIVDIAAKEQARIGEDLHDGLGQELTGLGFVADSLAQQLDAPQVEKALEDLGCGNVKDKVEEISKSIRKSREHLRQLARGLVPVPIEDGGLPEAIHRLAVTMDEWNEIKCVADVDDDVKIGDPAIATHVYRIAQEAVSNAVKHSEAGTIRIVLKREDGANVLKITDDGVGIEPPRAKEDQRGGIGLRVMDHRARLIGATLSIESGPDCGTTVRCIFHDAGSSF